MFITEFSTATQKQSFQRLVLPPSPAVCLVLLPAHADRGDTKSELKMTEFTFILAGQHRETNKQIEGHLQIQSFLENQGAGKEKE